MIPLDDNDSSGRRVLAAHVEECDACRADPPPVDHLAALLNRSGAAVDASGLSRTVMLRARPELQRAAARALAWRVAAAIGLALLPLPAVVAYDAYLLQRIYEVVSWLLPVRVATYLVLSYAASLTLLFAGTYATVPLLLARPGGPQLSAPGA